MWSSLVFHTLFINKNQTLQTQLTRNNIVIIFVRNMGTHGGHLFPFSKGYDVAY